MSNGQNRTPREFETREQWVRPEAWSPPQMLPDPVKKDGWAYRWVRTATLGEDDPGNIGSKRREGWEPVSIEEQPHMATARDPRSPFKGAIEIGGLILMQCPEEFMRQRDAYYAKLTKSAQVAVDNNLMKENDARMPLFQERKTKVTFGSGEA